MKAYVRCGDVELALHGPLATTLGVVADHLPSRARATLDRIALIDRERTPGKHDFSRDEMLELVTSAHALLAEPPLPIRRVRRVMTGPLPSAERVAVLASWLREQCGDGVVYDLWSSNHSAC